MTWSKKASGDSVLWCNLSCVSIFEYMEPKNVGPERPLVQLKTRILTESFLKTMRKSKAGSGQKIHTLFALALGLHMDLQTIAYKNRDSRQYVHHPNTTGYSDVRDQQSSDNGQAIWLLQGLRRKKGASHSRACRMLEIRGKILQGGQQGLRSAPGEYPRGLARYKSLCLIRDKNTPSFIFDSSSIGGATVKLDACMDFEIRRDS